VPAPAVLPDVLPVVRETVRSLLLSSPAYYELPPEKRNALAHSMVRVCQAASELIREEMESNDEIAPRRPRRLARAQATAGQQFSGVAAEKVAGTTHAILNAVSFPRFVTELINGVFKAMVDSSIQQMQSFVELLNNVSASLEGFADSNIGADRARMWLAQKYPASFEVSNDPDDPEAGVQLRLREGASMPSEAALRTDLGLAEDESVPRGDPESMLPFVRRQLAKQRQGMLSTMVMLGLQRIVVESGSIKAAMRFHIDTRSAAIADEGSTFSLQNQVKGSGSFGFGPWGVSASVSNTIGYVSTQRSQTTEEMNTDLELTSGVEINFKSDYLPLNRVASPGQTERIRANTLNPGEEARVAETARRAATAKSDQERLKELSGALRPQMPGAGAEPTPTPQKPAGSGTQTGGGNQSGAANQPRQPNQGATNQAGSANQNRAAKQGAGQTQRGGTNQGGATNPPAPNN
jgi:hypothetical protein